MVSRMKRLRHLSELSDSTASVALDAEPTESLGEIGRAPLGLLGALPLLLGPLPLPLSHLLGNGLHHTLRRKPPEPRTSDPLIDGVV